MSAHPRLKGSRSRGRAGGAWGGEVVPREPFFGMVSADGRSADDGAPSGGLLSRFGVRDEFAREVGVIGSGGDGDGGGSSSPSISSSGTSREPGQVEDPSRRNRQQGFTNRGVASMVGILEAGGGRGGGGGGGGVVIRGGQLLGESWLGHAPSDSAASSGEVSSGAEVGEAPSACSESADDLLLGCKRGESVQVRGSDEAEEEQDEEEGRRSRPLVPLRIGASSVEKRMWVGGGGCYSLCTEIGRFCRRWLLCCFCFDFDFDLILL